MKIIRDLSALKKEQGPIIFAAGFFDGLHRGHQKIIQDTIDKAGKLGGKAWVLTFDTHPMKILKPMSAPLLLTSNDHKLSLLARLDLDSCLLIPFTRQLADLEPRTFIRKLRSSVPALAEIIVGRNWRFGHKGKGDIVLLSGLAKELDFKVTILRPVLRKGEIVSSTRIRSEIFRGHLEEAAVMLGRPFSILGTVKRGRTIGRKLGFPTANLDSHNEMLPPLGVYAVHAILRNEVFNGVFNLGTRPTFKKKTENTLSLELHLLDLDDELYGENIEVFFVRKLRNERCFLTKKDLKRQIVNDIKNTRKLLSRKKLKESLYITN